MLALKLALDRAPQYQAQIKDWVFQPHRISHRLRARLAGFPLVWSRALLRSIRAALPGRPARARPGGRRADRADVWQFLQNGKLFALRIELDAPDLAIERLGPEHVRARLGDRARAASRARSPQIALNDLPAGTLVIRRGIVVLQDWNAALPELELRDVDLDLSARRALRLGEPVGAVAGAARRPPELLGNRLGGAGASRSCDGTRWRARAACLSPVGASCCRSI